MLPIPPLFQSWNHQISASIRTKQTAKNPSLKYSTTWPPLWNLRWNSKNQTSIHTCQTNRFRCQNWWKLYLKLFVRACSSAKWAVDGFLLATLTWTPTRASFSLHRSKCIHCTYSSPLYRRELRNGESAWIIIIIFKDCIITFYLCSFENIVQTRFRIRRIRGGCERHQNISCNGQDEPRIGCRGNPLANESLYSLLTALRPTTKSERNVKRAIIAILRGQMG